jgi:hypothetical protein
LFLAGRAQARGSRPSRRLLVSVAVALALVSLFFLLQVAPHSHANGQDDPACGLCQVAHIGIAPAITGVLLSLILLYFGEIPTLVCPYFAEQFSAQSPSRAPPALPA